MAITLDLQNDDAFESLPEACRFQAWVEAALQQDYNEFQQTVRIVDVAESRDLNYRYRGKDSPTNVLAFPSDSGYLEYTCLGDLVICAPVVAAEAAEQGKTAEAHWAHLVIHGMLHLQGFDHQSDDDTRDMEALEIKILDSLGVANPYNV